MMAELKEGNYAALAEFQVDAKTMYDKNGKLLTNNPTRFLIV